MWRTPLLPVWAVASALHPRLRADLAERWGLSVPPVLPGAIWVHAASVGEVGAALALAPHLDAPVLITADTDTGAARARALWPTSGVRPVDHPWTLAPLWADARPRLLVFVEGAWWPGLAGLARRAGVPVARVSARAGPRTRCTPAPVYRRLVRATSLVLARDAREAEWFRRHQDAPVEVGGDLKLCVPLPEPSLSWARPRVVGASTRPGDEAALLAARPPGHQLLLAPRHPERFAEVARRLEAEGLRWARRSELGGTVPPDLDVVLLDSVGELPGLIPGAAAVFVGGTFDAGIGGHSAAEAARAGVPVVAGPHRHANAESFARAELVVADGPQDLRRALAEAIRRRATPVRSDAAERTAARLRDLAGPPAPECAPRPWAVVPRVPRLPRVPVAVEVPVVAVGSVSARGPGKTSTARWVAARLAERGHRVGVLVHGVGRERRGIRTSLEGDGWEHLGDEGALHARDGHLVAAGRDRREGARRLVEAGATVLVLDDGLRDRHLRHDLRIGVVDARYPTGRSPFPKGEGRPVGRLDAVVVHHASDRFPYAPAGLPWAQAFRRPGPWRGSVPEGPVAAFAGLGRPADLLATLGVPVARFRALPDHRAIDEALGRELLRWAHPLPLVCSEKDAVRLPAVLRGRVAWRGIELEIEPHAADWLPGAPNPASTRPAAPPRSERAG